MRLEPLIGSILKGDNILPEVPPPLLVAALHNEHCDATTYPLRLEDGRYFSEVIGSGNRTAEEYRRFIRNSLEVLQSRLDGNGTMDFTDLIEAGALLQNLDADFAARRLDLPLDSPHSTVGPDRYHPYAKLTLLRTAFSVRVAAGLHTMLFEKFLVCYSYLDENGYTQPTLTPIHSHPLNFETVYFIERNADSHVTEQEFVLQYNGHPLVGPNGLLNPQFTKDAAYGRVRLGLRPGPAVQFNSDQRVRKLPPFESETTFIQSPDLLSSFDGYFRPHQVTVSGVKTRYFALDNYFSMTGRVILYDDAEEVVWNHDAWMPR